MAQKFAPRTRKSYQAFYAMPASDSMMVDETERPGVVFVARRIGDHHTKRTLLPLVYRSALTEPEMLSIACNDLFYDASPSPERSAQSLNQPVSTRWLRHM